MSERHEWAVVLGVSAGCGAAIAEVVSRRPGLDVFGMHRGNHPEQARDLEERIADRGRRAFFVLGDAGVPDGVELGAGALAAEIPPRSVRLFVHAIANASLGRFTGPPQRHFHPKQYRKTFDAMAHSFPWWVQAMVERDMLAPGARLLALTNPFSDQICDGFGMVSAAKAALEIYVRHLALELGPAGHRVNLLRFGMLETAALRRAFDDERWERARRRTELCTPAGCLATPAQVARLVPHLLDDDLDWFNGATIDFTGGQAMALPTYVFAHE